MASKNKESELTRLLPTKTKTSNVDILGEHIIIKNESKELDKRYYFKDGIRRIDYILVWEQERIAVDQDEVIRKRMIDYRRRFEDKLNKTGVELETEDEESEKMMIHFIKVHIPFELLCDFAEHLNLRVPLQVGKQTTHNFSEKILNFFLLPNLMKNPLPYSPTHFITAAFKKNKLEKYIGYEDESTFFTITQRHEIAYEILATQLYGRQSKAEIGIDRMIEEGVYMAAFPLHEGPSDLPPGILKSPELLNRRQILFEFWAKWSKFYKYQPLDNIREYFGDKIAIYFAWLGLYTAWLFPASIMGIFIFCYGIGTMNNYIPSKEICESNETYRMCPLCNYKRGCPYWNLSTICLNAKVTYLFDHAGTVFFSTFMSVWAVTFLENWKRKNAELSYRWDVMGYEEEDERPRPEYAALASERRNNPITGVEEPYFPENVRFKRMATGVFCIIIMFSLVLIFIIGVIIYRVLIAIPLFDNPKLRSQALIFANVSASIVNLILIMALGKIYEKLAQKLTQWEMHRTETEYEDQLIFKVYLFEFVNFYSSIFYIAFFKGRFNGYPGNYTFFFGLRNEECGNGSCLFELAQQLAIIMVGKQIINNIQEIFVPKIKVWLHRFSKGLNNMVQLSGSDSESNFWSEDYKLLPYEGLFDEYLEMVLQFGFITIFVAAFPLAPFFALLNNWLEIRLDATKLVVETRRPIPQRAEDIGVWYTILDVIVKLSIISNAFLIAFTSDFIPKQIYKYNHKQSLVGYINFTLAWAPNNSGFESCRYLAYRNENGEYTLFHWHLMAVRLAFVILFEHIVFAIAKLVDILIPDIPEKLFIEIKRRNFLAKQALLDSGRMSRVNLKKSASNASSIIPTKT